MTPDRPHRILLVGFMGSGKTTVGQRLAMSLGWTFVDADAEVEAAESATIAEIFAMRGEPYFRAVERSLMASLLERDSVVIATGGGWAGDPSWLSVLPARTLSVWLQVSPEEALRRAGAQPGKRPLLESSDPGEIASRLVDARTSSYALAHWKVDTERYSVEDVSARILEMFSGHDLLLDAE